LGLMNKPNCEYLFLGKWYKGYILKHDTTTCYIQGVPHTHIRVTVPITNMRKWGGDKDG